MGNQTYMAALQPETETNDGVVTTSSPRSPGSGTVSYSGGTLRFTLKGGLPNTTYFTDSSETIYIDSSGTYELNTFTTDANGNGSVSFTWGNLSPGGDLLAVEPQVAPENLPGPAGFIGGFSVPK